MRIYHVTTPEKAKQIISDAVLKASDVIVETYNYFGEQDFELEQRTHFALTEKVAEWVKGAFEYWRGGEWVIVALNTADDLKDKVTDYRAPGGFFVRRDIKLRKD